MKRVLRYFLECTSPKRTRSVVGARGMNYLFVFFLLVSRGLETERTTFYVLCLYWRRRELKDIEQNKIPPIFELFHGQSPFV